MVRKTLRQRYVRAEKFAKPTVLSAISSGGGYGWLVVGPGFKWLGDVYPSWDEAIEAALNGR